MELFDKIASLVFVCFWMIFGLFMFFICLKYIEDEYKKFYPNPLVNVILSFKNDNRFKVLEKWVVYLSCGILFLPLMSEWLVCWILYKFVKSVNKNYFLMEESLDNNIDTADNVCEEDKSTYIDEKNDEVESVTASEEENNYEDVINDAQEENN